MVLKIEMHFLPLSFPADSADPDWLMTDKHRQFPVSKFFKSFCFIKS